MKPWMKYGVIGIVIFALLLIVDLATIAGDEMIPNSSVITIDELEGIDSDYDGKIDSITFQITNYGTVAEKIVAIELSKMNKSWKLPDQEYPILLDVLRINLTLVSTSNPAPCSSIDLTSPATSFTNSS